MPQSLAHLNLHLVFCTKHRRPHLSDFIRPQLHSYVCSILQIHGCTPILINSVEHHIHLLFDFSRTVALCKVVEDVKKFSSKWMKTIGPEFAAFAWQRGYGVFAVSQSNVHQVRNYIARQREHHRRCSFQNEFRALLRKHQITFDEHFVWD